MSKAEFIWNCFIGIFLTLGNFILILAYLITENYSKHQAFLAVVFFLYGIVKISEMIYYVLVIKNKVGE